MGECVSCYCVEMTVTGKTRSHSFPFVTNRGIRRDETRNFEFKPGR